MKKQKQKKWS